MQITITNAERELDADGNLVNLRFTLGLFDKESGNSSNWDYRLTPDELSLDLDTIISRESQRAMVELKKIISPNVIEAATDYIGATIDATTVAIRKPVTITPPIKLDAIT